MKINLLFISVLFVFFFQNAQSKDKNDTHSFKIVGKTEVLSNSPLQGRKTVEYDPDSPNHLFITTFDKEGKKSLRSQFLFTGRKFDLSANFLEYVGKKEIIADGTYTYYNKDETIQSSILYKEGKTLQRTQFHPNGQTKSMIAYNDKVLDGEYKMWHANGKLYFSGYYANNLKNGDFEVYNDTGELLKKGGYQEGKLISGENIVLDMVYRDPEIAAMFKSGDAAFNEYLSQKGLELETSKIVTTNKKITLDLITDKSGKIAGLQNIARATPIESELIKALFKDCPDFSPATIENIPVQSVQNFTLDFSKDGIKICPQDKTLMGVKKMPEFPGGQAAFNQYLATSLKYPVEAAKAGIQGVVLVTYVVDEEGKIVNVKLVRGIDPLLDLEAIRVIETMPKHTPGEENGIPVKVRLTIPVKFAFTNNPNKVGWATQNETLLNRRQ